MVHMGYSHFLDAAPSSVSSSLVETSCSFFSTLGSFYMLYRLRQVSSVYWCSRHYLALSLAGANLVMSLTALISGCFFIVYGRIPSVVGCTISGMIEFWGQQTADICILFMTLSVLMSARWPDLWLRRKCWIQTGVAPVIGVVLFMPLAASVASFILWKFGSSEFNYCWIPRVPVYARWVAIEGWRVLNILTIVSIYSLVACMLVRLRARKRCNKDVLQRKSRRKVSIVGVSKKRPVIISVPRYSAIDSEAVSHASSADGRGLFSQSMYNVHRWATSIFGISSAGNGLAGKGLRVKAIRDSAGCRTSGCHRIDMQGSVSEGDGEGRQDQPRLSISLSVAKVSRSYYERFKRSIANSIVRRFIIATDIPSPTIPSAIFDDICGASAADGNSPSLTHCDVRSSTESVADEVDTTQNSAYPMSSDINVAMSWGQDAGGRSNLKRWYSAVSQFVSRPERSATDLLDSRGYSSHRRPEARAGDRALRRVQTAPLFLNSKSLLSTATIPLREPTPVLLQPGREIVSGLSSGSFRQVARSCSVKVRENSLNDEPSEDGNTASKENHRDSSPGIGQGSVSDCSLSCEGRCGDDRSQHGRSNLSVRSDDSVQLVDAQEIEGFESLEEGHWLTTVAQCRNIRGGNEEKGAKGSQEDKLYVTRMYVYPLAYVLVWLPSIFYYVLSTYIYYTAFEAKPSHHRGHSVHKRSRDMARLPAHWTSEQSMNRAWTPYQHATAGVWGSHHISWLAIIQGVHLLNGALDALLFWITER